MGVSKIIPRGRGISIFLKQTNLSRIFLFYIFRVACQSFFLRNLTSKKKPERKVISTSRKISKDCDFVRVTVDDRNCTAEVEGVGTLTVRGYDRYGRRSGYVYLNGKQICDGFNPMGATMLYSPSEPFSKFVKEQMELWKEQHELLRYRIMVKNSPTIELRAATGKGDFNSVASLVAEGAKHYGNKIRNSLPLEQRPKFDEAVEKRQNKNQSR